MFFIVDFWFYVFSFGLIFFGFKVDIKIIVFVIILMNRIKNDVGFIWCYKGIGIVVIWIDWIRKLSRGGEGIIFWCGDVEVIVVGFIFDCCFVGGEI